MSNTLDIVPELRDLIAASELMSKELVHALKQRDKLLEALRVCAAALKHAGDVPTADQTMDLAVALASARAAIAKAEGA